MKKVFLLAALVCSILSACTNNSKTDSKSHEHEDGSSHADHKEPTPDTTKQEEFNADSTSSDTTVKTTPHSHEDGKPHKH